MRVHMRRSAGTAAALCSGLRGSSLTEDWGRVTCKHCIGGTRAVEVKVGDSIEWCGRLLEVKGITEQTTGYRAGRRFLVIVDGVKRSLHYFDSEFVTVVPFIEDALERAEP